MKRPVQRATSKISCRNETIHSIIIYQGNRDIGLGLRAGATQMNETWFRHSGASVPKEVFYDVPWKQRQRELLQPAEIRTDF